MRPRSIHLMSRFIHIKPKRTACSGALIALVLASGMNAAMAAGRTGFPLLAIPVNARAAALAGAPVAAPGKVLLTDCNPANLATGERLATAAYGTHPAAIWSGRLHYQQPLRYGTAALFLKSLDYGSIEESQRDLGPTGRTLAAAEYHYGVSWAGELYPRLYGGLTAGMISGRLAEADAAGYAFDAGLVYDLQWEDVVLGAAMVNLGRQWDGYGTGTDPLPTELRLGGSKKLQHLPLTLHLTTLMRARGEGEWRAGMLPGEPDLAFAAGGEFEITPSGGGKPLYLRIGYGSQGRDQRVGHRRDTLSGFTFGFGIGFGPTSLDYAILSLGALGSVQRFGFAFTL
ncbi:MAG: PorV/PorQ family protein [Calditrichaeota bacterium]|nr:PorV/PorQ family protein [Calditrichota bacterium]